MNSFGQEFYPYESIRALKFADKTRIADRRVLIDHVASQLSQPSEMTRLRVAAKIVQRYLTGNNKEIVPPPQKQAFARLVARGRHTPTQIELLFLRMANVDSLVGTLARELFYPVCVAGRPPDSYTSNEFATQNGGQLFTTVPMLTRSFILAHARDHWNFTNRATLDRSLRVMQEAGLISRERMPEVRGHPPALTMSTHDVSLVTFTWALYEEFLPHMNDAHFSLVPEALAVSDFARTLLLSPSQIMAHCEAARRHQLLVLQNKQLRLVFGNLDAVTDALLSKAL
ncbi:MAG TPA: hypothetical protein VF719_12135 [Abditibacteriaceae bacterium]|jgi:hypothetical protein